MTVETRLTLDGLPDDQRVLALAHWYLWRVLIENPPAVEIANPLLIPLAAPSPLLIQTLLLRMEGHMQPATTHQLALAKRRYWKERAASQ